MIFAPTYSRHERSVIARLHLLSLDGERTIQARRDFRTELRERLVSQAGATHGREDRQGLALASR